MTIEKCGLCFLFSERFLQSSDGVSAMADDLLFFKFHLRERSRFTIRNKERIVAKAHVANRSVVDFATAFAFKNNRLADDKFTLSVLGDGLV